MRQDNGLRFPSRRTEKDDDTTRILSWERGESLTAGDQEILQHICTAMEEKGYDPTRQLTHYLMSGDPTYITAHRNARALVGNLERYRLIEAALRGYLRQLLR